jgi:hypothetical protein
MAWSALKVVDLRAELKKRGLPTTGKKAELISRLEESDSPQVEQGGVANNTEQPEEEVPVRQDTKKRDHEEDEIDQTSRSEAKRRRIDGEGAVKEEDGKDVKVEEQVIKEEEEHKVDPENIRFNHGDDDNDMLYQGQRNSAKLIKRGHECPYLDTISRQVCHIDYSDVCIRSPCNTTHVYTCRILILILKSAAQYRCQK